MPRAARRGFYGGGGPGGGLQDTAIAPGSPRAPVPRAGGPARAGFACLPIFCLPDAAVSAADSANKKCFGFRLVTKGDTTPTPGPEDHGRSTLDPRSAPPGPGPGAAPRTRFTPGLVVSAAVSAKQKSVLATSLSRRCQVGGRGTGAGSARGRAGGTPRSRRDPLADREEAAAFV